MPFWLRMDLRYGLADYQCWRTKTSSWTFGDRLHRVARREVSYLQAGSGAREEIGGPYHFPRITLRVMPLRAEQAKLQKLLDSYLKNDFFEFRAAGQIKDEKGTHSVVCLVGINFDRMTAATALGTEYSDRELMFAVPVLWWEKGDAGNKHPAVVPLYTFTGTDWNAATLYEVYGQLALKSEFVNPDESWLTDPAGPQTSEPLLTLKTELFPEPGKGQEAKEVTVLEVRSAPGRPAQTPVATYLRQLGMQHFWTGDRYHRIALKQVMDAEDPALASYQALIGLGRQFTGKKSGNPTTAPLAPLLIDVRDYPTFPIASTLGLLSEKCDRTGPVPKYTLRPINPFWVSGVMDGDAGLEMCWRVGPDWQKNPMFNGGHKPNTCKRSKKK
jgi:hypothetical protein